MKKHFFPGDGTNDGPDGKQMLSLAPLSDGASDPAELEDLEVSEREDRATLNLQSCEHW